ncbi:type III-A CRISPR-associated RAMP protein Csm3 [Lyngbya sp. CCY1209]|uniref:type III-A CRISPR-associated RAMP protein Csm3 n=1 Tax=Lyngbya sp. CCY1209 TaxID=2886103 RepID=UPI002D21132B|nr:type III-A CRISPR-associated RAMP protein Csm3 [Lyngbya sp. CCY1209]MEB3887259.1 type III-A CRISPR-associated RAMP protein Csm3 [Lyngbya sp. CCY1209]
MTVIERPQKPLVGKLKITGTLIIETGLHIGGGGETLEIGGLDKPVIRDPVSQYPYLPGSSIKGKLRSILERWLNKPLNRGGGSGTYRYESDDLESGYTEIQRDQYVEYEGAKTCQVSRLFGSTGGSSCWIPTEIAQSQELEGQGTKTIDGVSHTKIKGRNCPARLIVRDCHLTPESAEQLRNIDTGLYMTEWKFENGLDRVTAAANPRQLERVPAGSKFTFEMVYTVEDESQAIEDVKNLAIALSILEDDALGGHGSRGYGKVKFENFNFSYRDAKQYENIAGGSGTSINFPSVKNTSEFLSRFSEIQSQLPGS